MVVVLFSQWQGLRHQLQGTDAVALVGVDHPSAPSAPLVPPLKLAGDDEPMVRQVHVVLGRDTQQLPVVLVDFDHRFAKRVDLAEPVQPL